MIFRRKSNQSLPPYLTQGTSYTVDPRVTSLPRGPETMVGDVAMVFVVGKYGSYLIPVGLSSWRRCWKKFQISASDHGRDSSIGIASGTGNSHRGTLAHSWDHHWQRSARRKWVFNSNVGQVVGRTSIC
jgi:hypothetical protein